MFLRAAVARQETMYLETFTNREMKLATEIPVAFGYVKARQRGLQNIERTSLILRENDFF